MNEHNRSHPTPSKSAAEIAGGCALVMGLCSALVMWFAGMATLGVLMALTVIGRV